MTQAVIPVSAPAAVTGAAVPGGAPVAPAAPGGPSNAPSAAEGGEPTLEEIAASLPDPNAEAPAEPAAPVVEETAATEETAEAEAPVTPTVADEALERAEKAAKAAREGSRRFKEQQEMLRRQAYETQRQAQEAEQLRRENAAARQREEALKKDPYKALKDLGMTDEELARRALRENTPEALVHQLKEQVESERQARIALENRIAQEREAARQAQMLQQAESAFFEAAKDAETYPELAIRKPATQLAAARAALRQIEENGFSTKHFTHEQVAEAAEEWLKPTTPTKAAVAASTAEKPKPIVKTSGKTLTNAQAQTRTVAPAEWDSLTEEQQIAHIAAQLVET